MQKFIAMAQVAAIGLDVGDDTTRVCAVDGDGEIVRESHLRTTPREIDIFFSSQARTRVILEVGTHSPWMSRLIAKYGHEVIVANPR
jgi:hypothetical protein